ncbi:hypothetical protein CXF85_11630 [Colwellia sp. 75C3]|uniref:CIA30 family protein n=1 Tax=Colwellia sp. 75C3 TaxID=888425 RepID=UPI000C33F07D|nr:CIA30 family protein [Colwellia sp. 75C3]PKG83177.1 hypothetical protein CXF85_11630 [Colwellia sp. 75C3]
MIDFINKHEVDKWQITNDAVMGGCSNGNISISEEQGIFTGNISLKNNGGFSAVYRTVNSLNIGLEHVTIDIQGDGETYQVRLIVNVSGYRMAYKHSFNSIAGQRQKIRFTLADFQASFRGRNIMTAAVLKSEDIDQVGFLVTKKVTGPFLLSIFSLKFGRS